MFKTEHTYQNMPKAIKTIDPDVHFRALHHLEEDPHITQRKLAEKLNISLGAANYCYNLIIWWLPGRCPEVPGGARR